jgi:hypothetical protein
MLNPRDPINAVTRDQAWFERAQRRQNYHVNNLDGQVLHDIPEEGNQVQTMRLIEDHVPRQDKTWDKSGREKNFYSNN